MRTMTSREYRLATELRRLVRWATHGNKNGNPYGHSEVMDALAVLAEIDGISDPYDVETAPPIKE